MTNVRSQDVLHIIYVKHYETISCDIHHMQLWIDDNIVVENWIILMQDMDDTQWLYSKKNLPFTCYNFITIS
jgi:hypothetical protein